MANILQFFRIIVKKSMENKNYEQIGRLKKFFLANERQSVGNFRLDAWKGHDIQIRMTTNGLFLNPDSCTKFVNQESVQAQVWHLQEKGCSQ